jgi:phage repressor protein C with HTH and peptisase S24 domain
MPTLQGRCRLDPSGQAPGAQGGRGIEAVRRYLGDDSETDSILPDAVAQDFSRLPIYDVRASAGPGEIADENAAKNFLMFDSGWLRLVSRNPSKLFVLEVAGDSMWETLHNGDHTLVDPEQRNPRKEGIYVLRVDDALQVKRISMHPVTRSLTIKSDNPQYPTYSDISPDDISIVGRVVWIGRRL